MGWARRRMAVRMHRSPGRRDWHEQLGADTGEFEQINDFLFHNCCGPVLAIIASRRRTEPPGLSATKIATENPELFFWWNVWRCFFKARCVRVTGDVPALRMIPDAVLEFQRAAEQQTSDDGFWLRWLYL